ncbi:MAG TPA: hypothetical protein VI260_27425 [Blastocatellia bacterium]|jgi:hypothetical protein
MNRILFIATLLIFFAVNPVSAQSYEIPVEHEHTFRDCRGTLVIMPEGIEYRTAHKEDARAWRYTDLRQIKIELPKSIELVSYEDQKRMLGRDRVFKFKALEGEITSEIGRLLVERAARPVVTSVAPATEDAPTFEVPVKHLHRSGGCAGTLKVYPGRIVYESEDMPSDSRYWRYGDIQNISQSERYRFEIATFEDKLGGPKTYNFQLREALPAQAYDYVWARVYPSKFHSGEPSGQVGRPATSSERQSRKQ